MVKARWPEPRMSLAAGGDDALERLFVEARERAEVRGRVEIDHAAC